MRKFVALSAVLFCIAFFSAPAVAQHALYKYIDLGTLGGTDSVAYGVNDYGVAVGGSKLSDDRWDGFIWDRSISAYTDGEVVTNTHLQLLSINNLGDFTSRYGYSLDDNGAAHTYDAQGNKSRAISHAPVHDINNSRQIAATYDGECYFWDLPVYLASPTGEGFVKMDGTTAAGDYTVLESARGINELGHVAGGGWIDRWNEDTLVYLERHGFIWNNGSLTELGHLGDYGTEPYGINDHDQVVGQSCLDRDNDVDHAFLWTAGTITDLGTFGGTRSCATAINNGGVTVGWAEDASGESRAFAHVPSLGMVDLNVFAPKGSDWLLSKAHDISNHGHIVGEAMNSEGDRRAYMLQPTVRLEGAIVSDISYSIDGIDGLGVDGLPEDFSSLNVTVSLEGFNLTDEAATLHVFYDEDALALIGRSEEDLRLFWYDEAND